MFPSAAVTIAGERKTWRHNGNSGRWIDSVFCPTCGISVGFHSEGMPGLTGMPVGCFADPDFAPPRGSTGLRAATAGSAFHNDLTLLDTQDG